MHSKIRRNYLDKNVYSGGLLDIRARGYFFLYLVYLHRSVFFATWSFEEKEHFSQVLKNDLPDLRA